MFSHGLNSGWLPSMLQYICTPDEYIPGISLNKDECSWVGSLHIIGKMVGALLAAVLADLFGCKRVLILCGLHFLVVRLIIFFFMSLAGLYVSRVLYGLAGGMLEVTAPIFTIENSSPQMHATLYCMELFSYYKGIFIAYVLTTYFTFDQEAIINLAASVILLLPAFLLKETPYYLASKGRYQVAEKNFMWLEGGINERSTQKFQVILASAGKKTKASLTTLLTVPENRKRLSMTLLTNALIIATGFTGITNFITMSFTASASVTISEFMTMYGLLQVIFVVAAPWIVHKFNRRPLLMVAATISFASHASVTILHYINARGTVMIPHFAWLILGSNVGYLGTYVMILAPLATLLRVELLSPNVRATGSGIVILCNAIGNFLVSKTYTVSFDSSERYINHTVYATASLLLLLFTYFVLPETSEKSAADC